MDRKGHPGRDHRLTLVIMVSLHERCLSHTRTIFITAAAASWRGDELFDRQRVMMMMYSGHTSLESVKTWSQFVNSVSSHSSYHPVLCAEDTPGVIFPILSLRIPRLDYDMLDVNTLRYYSRTFSFGIWTAPEPHLGRMCRRCPRRTIAISIWLSTLHTGLSLD